MDVDGRQSPNICPLAPLNKYAYTVIGDVCTYAIIQMY